MTGGDLLLLSAIGLLVLALSVVFNSFGSIHFEYETYLPYQLGPGSIWRKIFDTRTLDQGFYQGRELSYLVDYWDVRAIVASVRAGFPLFVSATHVALSVGIGVWLGWFAGRDLKLGALNGILVGLLFWLTPYVYIHFQIRSAKILAAAGFALLAVEIYRAVTRTTGSLRLPWRYWLSLPAAALLLAFSDRQGYFFLLGIALWAGWRSCAKAGPERSVLAIVLAVIGVQAVYFFWIAPALTKSFFGYAADFSFNRIPLEPFLADPVTLLNQAVELFCNTTGSMLGHASAPLVLGCGIPVLLLLAWHDWKNVRTAHRTYYSVALLATVSALIAMYAMMILRHPPILWPDIRLFYYWLPGGAVVLFGALLVAGHFCAVHPIRNVLLTVGLLILVLRNLLALPEHQSVFAHGHLEANIRRCQAIREVLMSKDDPHYNTPEEMFAHPIFASLYRETTAPSRIMARDWTSPISFNNRFGGNVDPRFLLMDRNSMSASDRTLVQAISSGTSEMKINFPSNRIQGQLYVRRIETNHRPLTAEAAIFARSTSGTPLWHYTIELAPEQQEITLPYTVDPGQAPTIFRLTIPQSSEHQIEAGWRGPTISHVANDFPRPAWLLHIGKMGQCLDTAAIERLFGRIWHPTAVYLLNGKIIDDEIELNPGGEIWIHAQGLVTNVSSRVKVITPPFLNLLPSMRNGWYKGGRLQFYSPASEQPDATGAFPFRLWGAEHDGWFFFALMPMPDQGPVRVKIENVTISN